MNKYSKLILFDIDDTLVKAAGHIEAFAIGIKEVYGVNASVFMINPHGMTDPEIIFDVLEKKGLSHNVINSGLKNCMFVMADYYEDIVPDIVTMNLLPGVNELLDALNTRGYLLGLITGNIEPMARAKLKKVNINQYFKVGGFGSDSNKRSELVKIAINQAVTDFNFTLDNNVYVVGDTRHDVIAAIEASTHPICVATGTYTKSNLIEAGAPIVLDDLSDISSFFNAIST